MRRGGGRRIKGRACERARVATPRLTKVHINSPARRVYAAVMPSRWKIWGARVPALPITPVCAVTPAQSGKRPAFDAPHVRRAPAENLRDKRGDVPKMA